MTVLLTHGAGSNRDAPLLVAIDQALSNAGITVVRYNLPFRQNRTGPPGRGDAAKDRAGLASEVRTLREQGATQVILAGHSLSLIHI